MSDQVSSVGEEVADFIADTQVAVQSLMRRAGMSKSQLADALGVTRARVTQLFSEKPNMTLQTLARIFHALGDRPEIVSPKLRQMALERQGDGSGKPIVEEPMATAGEIFAGGGEAGDQRQDDLARYIRTGVADHADVWFQHSSGDMGLLQSVSIDWYERVSANSGSVARGKPARRAREVEERELELAA